MSAVEQYQPSDSGSLQAITGGQLVHFQDWSKAIATGSVLPEALRGKPADVLITVLHGLDLGLKPMQALNLVYVVKGRPSLSAEGMRALLQRDGHGFRVVECTAEKAIVEGLRRGTEEWHRAEFTDAQRRKAKLSGANWDAYPEDMLLARATTRLCRRFFSDVIGGLPGWEDVLDDTTERRPSLGEVAAARETPVNGNGDVVDAEVVDDEQTRNAVLDVEASYTGVGRVSEEQLHDIHDGYNAVGITDKQERLDFAASFIGRTISSATELTSDEAERLLAALADHAGAEGDPS